MPIRYEFEPLAALLDEGHAAMGVAHWKAIAEDQSEVPLDVDWDQYLAAEAAGAWKVFTARRDDRLIGYVAFWFQHPARYKSTLYITDDTIWVTQDEASRGLVWFGMLRAFRRVMPRPCKLQIRVRKRFMGHRTGKLLETLGLHMNEMIYTGFFAAEPDHAVPDPDSGGTQ